MAERGDTPDDPVTCHLPVGERAFLNTLRCPAGSPYRFERRGSVSGSCPDPATHQGPHPDPSQPGSIPVDHYELSCGCGAHSRTVYMDMYHPDARPSERLGSPVREEGGREEPSTKGSGSEGDERAEELKEVLRRHLRPGESFVVARDDEGEVSVRPGTRSSLAKSHPRLYGFLLAASQRINNSGGCGLFVFYLAIGAGLCFAIKAQAFDSFARGDAELLRILGEMRSAWVYVPVMIMSFWLYWKHDDWSEKRRYEIERVELAEHFARERLDGYEVLSLLEGDDEVSAMLKWMKADPRLSSLGH